MPPKKTTTIKKRSQQIPFENVQYGDIQPFQPLPVVLNFGHNRKQTKQASSSVNTPFIMRKPKTAQSGAQTQRKQTKQASSSVNTPFIMRKPKTAQVGLQARPQTAQSSMYAGPQGMADAWALAVPSTKQKGLTADIKPKTKVKGIDATVRTKNKEITAKPSVTYQRTGPDTPIPQFTQSSMYARPQTAQVGLQARPQTTQSSMYAGPQTAQMGLQTQVQQRPAMVSMGTMMVQQQEQANPQPTIMESIGSLFGYNKAQEAEVVNDFVYYGYEEDPKYYKKVLNKYGVTYLRSFAKQYGFKGYSTADKKELVKMLAALFAGRQEMDFNNRNCLGKKELKNDYTLQELRKAASKLKLKAYSNLSKNDLCQILHYYDNVHSQATEKTRKFLNKIYEKKILL